jgi:HPt (histidine-containing phosphotransfer) domain-containing protein
MNDHLPKPFEPADLLNMLARWRPGGAPPTAGSEPITPPAPAEPTTVPPPAPATASEPAAAAGGISTAAEKLVKNLGRDVARKLLERFVSDQPGALAGIDRAILSGDARAVRNGAHALRGVAGMLGFTEVARHASLLEAASREPSPQPETWPAHRGGLSSALEATCRELDTWLRQSAG